MLFNKVLSWLTFNISMRTCNISVEIVVSICMVCEGAGFVGQSMVGPMTFNFGILVA